MNKVCVTTIEFPKSFCEEYSCFNNFEIRIDSPKRKSYISNKPEHNVPVKQQQKHMQGIL